jgi:integrase
MVAPNSKINFTKATIKELPIPEKGQRHTFKDEKESGLIVRVTANGKKTFQLYKKFQGRPIRISLGEFDNHTKIEDIRKKAREEKAKLDKGTNSNIEKHKFSQEATLKKMFEEFMERYSKPYKKSWEYDEREIPKFLSHWFNRKISTITKHEIMKLHEKIRDNNGLYQANRILERIRTMYNKVIEWGWEGTNPTTGIKKFKEKSRDRFILPSEMPLLFDALEQEENKTARDYILVSLFTGARKTNVLQMRWEHIDWDTLKWRIPDTKNGEPVVIFLVPKAVEILEQRLKENTKQSPWVFSSDKSKEGYLVDPKKAWNRVRQRSTIKVWEANTKLAKLIERCRQSMPEIYDVGMLFKEIEKRAKEKGFDLPNGLMDIRLHDIRRTFGSYQAITGASLPIIGKSLGHKSQLSTQVYARMHDDPVREAATKASNAMIELANGSK